MKRTIARRARPLLLLMLSLCAAPGLAQVLSVESIQGKVTLERPEGSRSLAGETESRVEPGPRGLAARGLDRQESDSNSGISESLGYRLFGARSI